MLLPLPQPRPRAPGIWIPGRDRCPQPLGYPTQKKPRQSFAIASVGTPTSGVFGTSINKIAAVVDGNIMLVYQVVYDNTVTLSPPGDWTTVDTRSIAGGTATKAALHYKIASGEGASYTFGNSGGAYTDLMMVAYSGVDTTTPIDAASTFATGTSGTPSMTGPSPVSANTYLVIGLSGYSNDAGAISGMTTRIGPIDTVNYMYDQAIAATGAVGTRTATNTSDGWIMIAVSLRPTGAAPATSLLLPNRNRLSPALLAQ